MKKIEYFIKEMRKLPNLITSVRLFLIPVLFFFAYTKNLTLFTVFFYICGLSDQIDGIVARKLNMCSKFGNNLDSFADELYYYLGLIFLYMIKPSVIFATLPLLIVLFSAYALDRQFPG